MKNRSPPRPALRVSCPPNGSWKLVGTWHFCSSTCCIRGVRRITKPHGPLSTVGRFSPVLSGAIVLVCDVVSPQVRLTFSVSQFVIGKSARPPFGRWCWDPSKGWSSTQPDCHLCTFNEQWQIAHSTSLTLNLTQTGLVFLRVQP